MNQLNKKFAVLAAALLVLAVFSYRHGKGRAERFESGQKFLQNLNPDEIGGLRIFGTPDGGTTDGESVSLTRQGNGYVVAERNGYIARNEEVNRVVRDLLEVSLEKRMGEGETLAGELGLQGKDAVAVVLENLAGEEMVSFRLGDTADNGGRYVQRTSGEDQAIYRTEEAFSVASDPTTYLRKEIVDHSSGEIVRIQGPDFVLAKEQDDSGDWQGSLEFEDGSSDGSAKASEVTKLSSLLSRFSFASVFVASDPRVAGLRFDRSFLYDLADKSSYKIDVAELGGPGDGRDDNGASGDGDEACYVRIGGIFNVARLEVSQEETDEELEVKADVLRRSEEVSQFDQYHGSWVYQLDTNNCEKLGMTKTKLTE